MDSNTGPKQTGRPPKSAAGDVRQRLITATAELFQQYEYQQINTRQIAQRADTSPAMIRYYFKNKEGLFHATMRERDNPIHGLLLKLADKPCLADLHQVFTIFYDYFQQQKNLPSVIQRNLLSDEHPELLAIIIENGPKPAFEVLQQILKKLQQAGQIKTDLDLKLLAIQIISLCIYPCAFQPFVEQYAEMPLDRQFYKKFAQQNYAILVNAISTEHKDELA